MEYNYLISLSVMIFLFNTVLVGADSLYLTDTLNGLNYGEERIKTYTLDGNSYRFDLRGCQSAQPIKCAIFINDIEIERLSASDSHDLDDNYYIRVDSIELDFCDNKRFCDTYFEAYDIVEFSIYSRAGFCGDNNCDSIESCSSCLVDCGKCQIVCGDGYCESNEDCDSCEKDCGKCELCGDGICQSNEDCDSCEKDCGKCELCGDGICQSNEDCSSCSMDCGCGEGYECLNKKCIKSECSTDVDCDDEDVCTIDICSGSPKKCSNKRTSGCYFKNNCIPIGSRTESQYCSVENLMENLKSVDEKCNNNHECSSSVCVNNRCMGPTLIQNIINWFRRLFGK